ncbi:hypothetical protein BLNAU_16369 [Blattamonas nauphoetae]|uniref:Uncharacterized protein n=1 Tax=Blattamonas nauphoetae TaxID=2049346 RepID=A0ABQ9XEK5_9EUKA|nr:hypothetical protein BLNAU_16369 [Blattamonas nauphoetae]
MDEERFDSEQERAVVFRSLVATVKLQPALNASLEAKVVKFLEFVRPRTQTQVIINALMKMLNTLYIWCSVDNLLLLVKADLITQIILTLNPLTFSFTEAADIHINLMESINWTVWLITPDGLSRLRIQNHDGRQAVYETVFKQVLTLSEKYIWHLCVNRISMADDKFSYFLTSVLARLLEVCPYHQPTMEFVLHMPVILTLTSCLTFFEDDESIWSFLSYMASTQRELNVKGGEVREMGKTMHRMLRMEGIEDAIEEKLRNNSKELRGGWIIENSIRWNNLHGMNLSQQE